METITQIVKEQGITDIIYDMKNQFERYELMDSHCRKYRKNPEGYYPALPMDPPWDELTENEKIEFIENIDWSYFCSFTELSPEFLIEFEDKICWNGALIYQKHLTFDIIYKMMKKHRFTVNFTIYRLKQNKYITRDIINKIKNINPRYWRNIK